MDWPVLREVGQFVLAGIGAAVAIGGFGRQIVAERPRLTGETNRGLIISEDVKTAVFAKVEIELTNHSRLANAVNRYWLEIEYSGETHVCEPAILGTTTDDRWFLRSRDEQVTAYFPNLIPPSIPISPVHVAPGETVSFQMAFELPFVPTGEAIAMPMAIHIGATKGEDIRLTVRPIEKMYLSRSTREGSRPIQLYDQEGRAIRPEDVDFDSSSFMSHGRT